MAARRSHVIAAASVATAAAAGAALVATGTAQAAPSTARLAGSVAAMVTHQASVGTVPAAQQQTIQVWLRPNEAAATTFADAVSSPGNAAFHQYLSPRDYTARFGPSAQQAKDVQDWLGQQGLAGAQVSAQRDYVTATGTTAAVEKTFGVKLNLYRTKVAGKTAVVQSNDRDVVLPAALAPDVLSVTGLNNVQPTFRHGPTSARPATAAAPDCSKYWGEHAATLVHPYKGITKAPLEVCGYSAQQLRAAYGASSQATGKGQTVALIEVGQPTAMFQTLSTYAKTNGLPAPKSTQLKQLVLGQGGDCENPFDFEEQLDSEATYAMAPNANQLMVDGDSCNMDKQGIQALFDAELAPLTTDGDHPSASIESNCWAFGVGEAVPVLYPNTAHAINLRATAEGVGMYFASGDNPGTAVPATDPYSLAVGGTTVGINAKNGRDFETGWSNEDAAIIDGQWSGGGIGGNDASGGGVSLLYGQPDYQKGVVPASMSTVAAGEKVVRRTTPDISADADPYTGMLEGYIEPDDNGQPGPYETFSNGGTSLSTPLVAGLVADAQQGQKAPFGFVNKAIYRLYGTTALHDTLPVTASTPGQNRAAVIPGDEHGEGEVIGVFDSELPDYTDQVTRPGYDTMTGVGTPNGSAFISALRKLNR